ncbi:MAG TPA: phosphoribosylformylglycinamidine synthase subunit PurL [Thermoplasmata archaeon]|nr:phosphoribosylformylglycinamidine synthase subunit PurL [Thermoplasmata archaeon]
MKRVGDRYVRKRVPFPLVAIRLSDASDAELTHISGDLALALSVGEMRWVQAYFREQQREPTDVELQSLGQAWSEHCCYKSSKVFLREFIFPVQTPDVLDRGDAGVMEFDADHAYALRLESHNHPSAVVPYGGATTGIGGIIRDVLAMGAQPIALADPLHFGPLDYPFEELPKGTLHPKYLFSGVVAGIRDYGNRLGIPTVAGCVVFDEGYVGNIVVNVGCVGFAKKSQLVRNRVKTDRDVFVLCGGPTGRDGIHGVTYASVDLTEEAVGGWEAGAVQLGDPIMKEPLIHAIIECAQAGVLNGLKDLGGGGLSCVIGEMALAGGYGAEVDLDRVPLKESGLAPWEIWVSESQERMMLAVAPESVDRVLRIFDLYDVPATPIGRVIPETVCRVRYKGEVVLQMDLAFYTNGPEYSRPTKELPVPTKSAVVPAMPKNLNSIFLRILSAPNVASKEYVIRQYDHEVRASTVLKPMQGVIGKATHGDAAVVKPLVDSWRALAIASASTGPYTALDPYRGGATAVEEVCRNLVAVGARPHAITNCLNFGNPEKPDRLWFFREAVRGIGEAASAFGLAVPSGNVSLYNERPSGPVLPTPVVLGVGIVEDIRRCVTSDWKRAGDRLYLIGTTGVDLGGSEYYRVLGIDGGEPPAVNLAASKAALDSLLGAITQGSVSACHDLSHGGLAVAAAEMALGGDLGARIALPKSDLRFDIALFSESNGRWLVEARKGRENEFLDAMDGLPVAEIGRVGGQSLVLARGRERIQGFLPKMRKAWSDAIPNLVVVS